MKKSNPFPKRCWRPRSYRTIISGAVVMSLWLCTPAFAESAGKGRGKGDADRSSIERQGERVVHEAVDAVVDEAVGDHGTSGMPPGLAKQGKMPPGLAKQGKTPPGWDKGQKEGWGDGKKESPLRRLIRGIFRKGPPKPDPTAQ